MTEGIMEEVKKHMSPNESSPAQHYLLQGRRCVPAPDFEDISSEAYLLFVRVFPPICPEPTEDKQAS